MSRWSLMFVVAWLTAASAVTVATRTQGFPHRSQDVNTWASFSHSWGMGAATAASLRNAGTYHRPTHEALTREIGRVGHLPTYPQVPARAPAAELQREYSTDIGYGTLLGLWWKLFRSNSLWSWLGLQLVLDISGLLALSWACLRLAGLPALFLVSVLYAFCAPLAALTPTPTYYAWPAYGAALAFGGVVWLGTREAPTGGTRWFAAAVGLVVGVVIVVRSALMFALPVSSIAAFGALPGRWRSRLVTAAVVMGAGLLVLGALGTRNYREFGSFMITRGTFWHSVLAGIGNTPGNASGYEYDDRQIYQRIVAKYGPVGYATPEYERLCRQEALAHLSAHPGFYPRRFVRLLWDALVAARQDFVRDLPGRYLFYRFFPLALLGYGALLVWNWREIAVVGLPAWLWLAVAGGIALPLMPPAAGYYRVGADVMLLVILSLGAGGLIDAVTRALLRVPRARLLPRWSVGRHGNEVEREGERAVRARLAPVHVGLAVVALAGGLYQAADALAAYDGPTPSHALLLASEAGSTHYRLADRAGQPLASPLSVPQGAIVEVSVESEAWMATPLRGTLPPSLPFLFETTWFMHGDFYETVLQDAPVRIGLDTDSPVAGLRWRLGSSQGFSEGRIRIVGDFRGGTSRLLFQNPTYSISGILDLKFPSPLDLVGLQLESLSATTVVRSLQRLVPPEVPRDALVIPAGVERLPTAGETFGVLRARLRFPIVGDFRISARGQPSETLVVVVGGQAWPGVSMAPRP